jgi:hypothetical protein
VEHLYAVGLPPGRYDLQVLKNGSVSKRVTPAEAYALAFEFGPPEIPRWLQAAENGGQFQAQLIGDPLQSYLIQITSDFRQWTPILTNTTSFQGSFDFSEAIIAGPGTRCYRAIQLP